MNFRARQPYNLLFPLIFLSSVIFPSPSQVLANPATEEVASLAARGASSEYVTEWVAGMQLGEGADTFAGERRPKPFRTWPSDSNLREESVGFLRTVDETISSRREYVSAMSGSFRAKAKSWGGGVSGGMSMIKDAQISATDLTCTVSREWHKRNVLLSPQATERLAFTNEARRLLSRDPVQFHKVYGDGFIIGFQETASLVALIKIITNSEQTLNQIKGDISAEWKGFWQASGSANFQERVRELEERMHVVTEFTGSGLPRRHLSVSSISGLKDLADSLPSGEHLHRSHAIIYPYSLMQEYRSLTNPSLATRINNLIMTRLNEAFLSFEYLLHSIEQRIDTGSYPRGRLDRLKRRVQSGINRIRVRVSGSADLLTLPTDWDLFDEPDRIEVELNRIPPVDNRVHRWTLVLDPYSSGTAVHLNITGNLHHGLGLRTNRGGTMRMWNMEIEGNQARVSAALHNQIGYLTFYAASGTVPRPLILPPGSSWEKRPGQDVYDVNMPDATGFAAKVVIEGDLHGGIGWGSRGGGTMRVDRLIFRTGEGTEFRTRIHNVITEFGVWARGEQAPIIQFCRDASTGAPLAHRWERDD